MDRIENNVFEAKFQVHEGKEQIEEAQKREASPRATACLIFLVKSIVICIIFIAYQHSN
jgi:t-SNARE complex subunit (syntaxin)